MASGTDSPRRRWRPSDATATPGPWHLLRRLESERGPLPESENEDFLSQIAAAFRNNPEVDPERLARAVFKS